MPWPCVGQEITEFYFIFCSNGRTGGSVCGLACQKRQFATTKKKPCAKVKIQTHIQGGSNMTGTDLYVNKAHCAAAVRP